MISTSASVSTKTSGNSLREDTCRTFDSLCEEIKRLVHTVAERSSKHASADREQRQMNSVNIRLHAVVQHMSTFDIYKRKKRYSTADEPSTATQHATNRSQSPPTPAPETLTRTSTTETKAHNQSIIKQEIFKRFSVLANQTVDVGKKFAEILRIECVETRLKQLTELEQSETGIWSTTIGQLKQSIQFEIQLDKESIERAEQARIREEQRVKAKKEAEEQARLRREREEREIEERLQKDLASIQLQFIKTQADSRCRVAWLQKRSLVRQRRANQSANAG